MHAGRRRRARATSTTSTWCARRIASACAPGSREAGVASGLYYATPLHLQPVFAHLGYAEGSLPVTERCARECLALPMFPTLGEAAQREVVDAVAALSPTRS